MVRLIEKLMHCIRNIFIYVYIKYVFKIKISLLNLSMILRFRFHHRDITKHHLTKRYYIAARHSPWNVICNVNLENNKHYTLYDIFLPDSLMAENNFSAFAHLDRRRWFYQENARNISDAGAFFQSNKVRKENL